jgi:hypothetical protein
MVSGLNASFETVPGTVEKRIHYPALGQPWETYTIPVAGSLHDSVGRRDQSD